MSQCEIMKHFREDLHRKLLSTDFKKQVDGLELLQKVVFGSYALISYLYFSPFSFQILLLLGFVI